MPRKYLIALLVLVVGACSYLLYQSYWGPRAIAQREVSKIIAEANSQLQTAGVAGLYTDTVESRSYWALPPQIKQGLGYSSQEVRAVVYAKASFATQLASFVISAGRAISRASDIIIGGADSTKALNEALQMTVAKEAIVKTGSVGKIVVDVYQMNEAGQLVKSAVQMAQNVKGAATPALIAAQAASMVLSLETDYIRNNTSRGLDNLWKYGTVGGLELYIVFFSATNKGNLDSVGGARFYYYNTKTGSWINYYNAVAGGDVLLKPKT